VDGTGKAWSRVYVDFGGPIIEVHKFTLVDSITKQLTAQTAVEKLMEILVSDGKPAFISERFKEFKITNSVKHIISSPGHPSTNGQVENTINTVKTSIKAAIEDSKAKRQ
jgi:transposase InsO family protein